MTSVLLVDDDRRNLVALAALLDGLGLELVTASSGAECLRAMLTREFAAVLLDVQMPEMDGFETATLIRARPATRHVPILFLTAFSHGDEAVRRGYEIGAVDFLFKPLEPAPVRAKVSVFAALHRARKEAELAQLAVYEKSLAQVRSQMSKAAVEAEMALERRANERLTLLADQLQRQTEALAEAHVRKDEFLAMLGHELRNPLASLQCALDVAANTEADYDVTPVFRRQVKHLGRLVDDLLDLTRISRGTLELHLQSASLRDIVEHAIEQCEQLLARKRHQFDVEFSCDDVHVVVDADRLTQALANLVANAARYTDPGGQVRLAVRREDGEVMIEVADNGRGISPTSLPDIFEAFVQVDRSSDAAQGFGLGLSLVRRLVELHGGRVTVASEGIGCGSVFTMRFPAVVATREPEAAPAPTPTPAGALDIVVIDDNEDLLMMLETYLRSRGHVVSAADGGISGLQLLLDRLPEVAIVDIGLPGIDGYEIARRFRAAHPECRTKLVAMSGYGQQQDRERALAAGFDEHLVKPVEAARLEDVLRAPSRRSVQEIAGTPR